MIDKLVLIINLALNVYWIPELKLALTPDLTLTLTPEPEHWSKPNTCSNPGTK